MEKPDLSIIENKIIHLSEELEKLLNALISLEGNDFVIKEKELKYEKELDNYIKDKNPKIQLVLYIVSLIDNIRKEMNNSIDIIYSQNNFEHVPINFKEAKEKLKDKDFLI